MKINTVLLENIRSYISERVDFPDGSVLLSGDIGHGKSSLLLAIEFALFGIRPGELSGDELLREGEKDGGVTVSFSIDGKEYGVKRTLRRRGDSVGQHKCSFFVDGEKETLTASEMKAKILELLGYPEELLSKRHSYIYRYTVYTPQEMMKDIIYASEEQRLQTLRNVFGINRYKRIRENIGTVRTEFRSLHREYQGRAQGLDADEHNKKELLKMVKDKDALFSDIHKQYEVLKKKKDEKKQKWQQFRDQLQTFNKLTNEKGKRDTRIQAYNEQLRQRNEHKEKIKKALQELSDVNKPTEESEEELTQKKTLIQQEKERIIKEPTGVSDEIDDLLSKIKELEEQIKKSGTQQNTLLGKNDGLQDSIDELKKAGDICPVCGANLSEKHKQEEIKRNQDKIRENKDQYDTLDALKKEHSQNKEECKKQVQDQIDKKMKELNEKIENISVLEKKLSQYKQHVEKKKQHQELIKEDDEQIKKLKDDKQKDTESLKKILEQLEEYKDVKEQEQQAQKIFENIQDQSLEMEKKHTQLQTEIKGDKEKINTLNTIILQKKQAVKFGKKIKAIETWLDTYLSNLAGTVERHFMLHLQKKFNSVFSRWYQQLIDDESLSVRVDDKFTPIIEREGYETKYRNLSGGEKTSVALAYRLALNTVINTMIEEIKTRDLIILDEPTDGFSNNQLDKVRDVINELGMRQTILVSHEPKMESYVDEIIQIRKEDGISKAIV